MGTRRLIHSDKPWPVLGFLSHALYLLCICSKEPPRIPTRLFRVYNCAFLVKERADHDARPRPLRTLAGIMGGRTSTPAEPTQLTYILTHTSSDDSHDAHSGPRSLVITSVKSNRQIA